MQFLSQLVFNYEIAIGKFNKEQIRVIGNAPINFLDINIFMKLFSFKRIKLKVHIFQQNLIKSHKNHITYLTIMIRRI